jgi:hypothetical protein
MIEALDPRPHFREWPRVDYLAQVVEAARLLVKRQASDA